MSPNRQPRLSDAQTCRHDRLAEPSSTKDQAQRATPRLTLGVLAILALTTPTPAATLHVPADHPTIQGCIDAAVSGQDECVVAPGTYAEPIIFFGKAIVLRSSVGPELTTIDAQGALHAVVFAFGEGPDTVLEGFTVTGGDATIDPNTDQGRGAGIYVGGSNPTVRRCIITGNSALLGGGMFNFNSSPTVTGCVFVANSAESGGAMYNFQNSQPTLTNCLFNANVSSVAFPRGVAVHNYDNSNSTIINCTFSGHIDIGGSVVHCSRGSFATLRNCIFWDNASKSLGISRENFITRINVAYSIIEAAAFTRPYAPTGTIFDSGRNIDIDPMFVDPLGPDMIAGTLDDDFRLGPCSQAIDSGNNRVFPEDITTDLTGYPRFVDDVGVNDPSWGMAASPVIDIGAFERQILSSGGAVINATQNTRHCSIQNAVIDSLVGDEIVVPPGTYFESIDFLGKAIKVRSTDGFARTTIDGNGDHHVVQCISGENRDTILDGFTITGGWAPENGGGMFNQGSSPTITACRFTGNRATDGGGMFNEGGNPRVIACTFDNNCASIGGGMYNSYSAPSIEYCSFNENEVTGQYGQGGGLFNYNSNAQLNHCVFKRNWAEHIGGGVLNNYSTGQFHNCLFHGNYAGGQGGGVVNGHSETVFVNCELVGNQSYWNAGGMYNAWSAPLLVGCTMTRNSANNGGAMTNWYGSVPIVSNCILWDNVPNELSLDLGAPFSSVRLMHSDVGPDWGITSVLSNGNINVDPLFVRSPTPGPDGEWGGADDDYGDLRLQPGSPCINTGSAALLPPDEADIDGDGNTDEPLPRDFDGLPRVLCGEVDMGAYEFGIGDYDCNQAVNLDDFASWAMCMIEPADGPYAHGCETFDFDGDGTVTLRDFAGFQTSLGPS